MRIGIGLPAAVPGADMTLLSQWATAAEEAAFEAVGVIDRLVYDNLDPLVALAAAAAVTRRVELMTTVLNVGWRRNPVLLAKQLASVELVSGGRLTAGLGLGGWPEDFTASGVSRTGLAEVWDQTLAAMWAAWDGTTVGQGGSMTIMPKGRPTLLFGGLVAAARRRAAAYGQGWVAPLVGLTTLRDGAAELRRAWDERGRQEEPRIVTGRYFCLGTGARAAVDDYIGHYYGAESVAAFRADTITTKAELGKQLDALAAAGATDVLLYPVAADLTQLTQLAATLGDTAYRLQPPGREDS